MIDIKILIYSIAVVLLITVRLLFELTMVLKMNDINHKVRFL